MPLERDRVSLVLARNAKHTGRHDGAAYYAAKRYASELLERLAPGAGLRWEPLADDNLNDPWWSEAAKPFIPGRAAVLVNPAGAIVGVVGEWKPAVRKAFKLPEFCAGFELDLDVLQTSPEQGYLPQLRFPQTVQDICLRVDAGVPYAKIFELTQNTLSSATDEGVRLTVSPVDIYVAENQPDKKQITLRVTVAHPHRTLTDTEVTRLLDAIADAADKLLSAERV